MGYQPALGEPAVIAVDASGVQVVRRKDWMHKKRKGFVKIHVGIAVKTKEVVSPEITDVRVHDSARFKGLVEGAWQRTPVAGLLGDGSCDSEESYALPEGEGKEAGILPRKNAQEGRQGARAQMVKEIQLKKGVYNMLVQLSAPSCVG